MHHCARSTAHFARSNRRQDQANSAQIVIKLIVSCDQATQAAVAMVNNGGDISKTLEQLGSSEDTQEHWFEPSMHLGGSHMSWHAHQ